MEPSCLSMEDSGLADLDIYLKMQLKSFLEQWRRNQEMHQQEFLPVSFEFINFTYQALWLNSTWEQLQCSRRKELVEKLQYSFWLVSIAIHLHNIIGNELISNWTANYVSTLFLFLCTKHIQYRRVFHFSSLVTQSAIVKLVIN